MNTKLTCQIRTADLAAALARYMSTYDHCAPATQQTYLGVILAFLAFVQESSSRVPGHLFLPDKQLMEWLHHISRKHGASGGAQRLRIVDHFMAAMHDEGAIRVNPIAELKKRFGARGRRGIVEALRSDDPQAALDALRPEPAFSGSFGHHAKGYLDLHRATGEDYREHELTLAEFNRFLRGRSGDSITSVTPALMREWHESMPCSGRHARNKVFHLRNFFAHAVQLGVIRRSPVTRDFVEEMRPAHRGFRPYVFTQEQVAAVLRESMKLQSNHMFKLKADTMHIIVRVLYTLGLRLGEALRLQLRDIDLEQGTLWVRETKFHKERLLPFGPGLREHLRRYLDLRRHGGAPVRSDDPLFLGWRRIGHSREALTHSTVRKAFYELLHYAGITTPAGYQRPRLHDLRHSFAVHRLLRWYKEGVDVQNRLVLLATFMGHSSIFSSQVYLTITGSLLNEASRRFQKNFGALVGEEQRP